MLALEDLDYGYGRRRVGAGLTLSIAAGESLCLLGPNGCGKTTLFKTLLGLLPALGGRVLLDGLDIADRSRAEIARVMAYVPQAHAAFFPFTVEEVVLMGRASRLTAFASPGARDRAIARHVLETLGIGHLASRVYTEISGGERQLALVARALAAEPRLLVMDEPTASLDFGNQVRVLSQVRGLTERGIAVILATHDPAHAFLCANRVAALHDGRLAALGPPSETVTPATLRLLYGVEVVVAPITGGSMVCAPVLP